MSAEQFNNDSRSEYDKEFDALDAQGRLSAVEIREELKRRGYAQTGSADSDALDADTHPTGQRDVRKPRHRHRSYSGPVSDADTGHNDPYYRVEGPIEPLSEDGKKIIAGMRDHQRMHAIAESVKRRLEEQRTRPMLGEDKTEEQIREEETLRYDALERAKQERKERGY